MRDRNTLHLWGLALLLLPGILGQSWSVWYQKEDICAVRKSTVIIPCGYTYPNKNMKVENVTWCKPWACTHHVYHNKKREGLIPEINGRAEYLGDTKNNCTLKIKDMRDNDSGKYAFRFEAKPPGDSWTAITEVKLTVTGVEVKMTTSREKEPIIEGDNVTLTCKAISSCELDQSKLTLLKNKRLLPESSSILELKSISHRSSGNYSCALKENITISFEEIILDVQYAPQNTSVSVSPRVAEEGSAVTLTCSSDANPPVQNYTWFKNGRTVPSEKIAGQIYTISNASSRDSGQYHCKVQNQHGSHNSTAVTLSVPAKHSAQLRQIARAVGIIVFIVLAVVLVAFIYFKRGKAKGQTEDPGSTKGGQATEGTGTTELQLPQPQDQARSSQEEELSYATVHFSKKQPNRSSQMPNEPGDDSTIYSTLRA